MRNTNAFRIVVSVIALLEGIAFGRASTQCSCYHFECNGYVNGTIGYNECIENNPLWLNPSECSYCTTCNNETACSCDTEANCYDPLKSDAQNSAIKRNWWLLSGIIIGLLAITIISSVVYISYKIAMEDNEIKKRELKKIRRKGEARKKRKVKFKEEQPNTNDNKVETVKTTTTNQNTKLMNIKSNESMDESITIELPDNELIEASTEVNVESLPDNNENVEYKPHTHQNMLQTHHDLQTTVKKTDMLPLSVPRGSCKVPSHSISSDRYNAAMEEIENCTPDVINKETNLSLAADERFKHHKYESYQL